MVSQLLANLFPILLIVGYLWLWIHLVIAHVKGK